MALRLRMITDPREVLRIIDNMNVVDNLSNEDDSASNDTQWNNRTIQLQDRVAAEIQEVMLLILTHQVMTQTLMKTSKPDQKGVVFLQWLVEAGHGDVSVLTDLGPRLDSLPVRDRSTSRVV